MKKQQKIKTIKKISREIFKLKPTKIKQSKKIYSRKNK